jgi:putative flippase GtrA
MSLRLSETKIIAFKLFIKKLMNKSKFDLKAAILLKLTKFGVTGLLGMVIDFSVTYLLFEKIGLNPLFASGMGFSIAATNNYFINSIWTFGKKYAIEKSKFFKFFIISFLGLVLNYMMLLLLTSYTDINFYLCKVITVGIVFIWNFIANYTFTFKTNPSAAQLK